jgi:glycolate oxidase FAD binding subunit
VTDSGDVAQQRLAAIVGHERIRAAGEQDAIDGIRPRWIVEPKDAAGVAKTLACANESAMHVVARGSGAMVGWGAPPRSLDFILSTTRLNRVVEHAAADMTATVQAGATIESFQLALAAQNQRLALDPLWPDRSTIGGILATNDSGSLRGGFGTLRDLLIGITIALPDGTLARSGGKVVKNVAGYDLQKLMIGSFGTLAVIVEATFRLHPLPLACRNLQCSTPGDRLERLAPALNELSLLLTSAQIMMDGSSSMKLALRVESVPEAIEDKCRRICRAMEALGIQPRDVATEAWGAREELFDLPDATVCRLALLASFWPELHVMLERWKTQQNVCGQLVAQAAGGGFLALSGPNGSIVKVISELRQKLASLGGSAVVLKSPRSVKEQLDVWGAAGDSIALMKRIKAQFDENNVLAPGRFVGGI